MKKKYLLMGVTAAMVVAVAVSGSLAAISASGRQATNKLAAPELKVGVTNAAFDVDATSLVPGDALDQNATKFVVSNSQDISEYTRVTVRKYWTNEDGEKDMTKDASLLNMTVSGDWITADGGVSFSSGETDVFYLSQPLEPGQSVELPLAIEVSNEVDDSYQNYHIQLEVTVDSVQYVSGEDELNQKGIESTFGVLATLNSDGSIQSLTQ